LQTNLRPEISDVSEIIHAGKKGEEQFRDYDDESNPQHLMVKRTYNNMHTGQTVDFVKGRVRQFFHNLKHRDIVP
jgi:hypothetical protein